MLNDVKDWLADLVAGEAVLVAGEFIETKDNQEKFLLVMKQNGGGVKPPFILYPRFSLILLGRHGRRDDLFKVYELLNKIVDATDGEKMPCGIGGARTFSLPTGPHYTKESRVYYMIDIEFIK